MQGSCRSRRLQSDERLPFGSVELTAAKGDPVSNSSRPTLSPSSLVVRYGGLEPTLTSPALMLMLHDVALGLLEEARDATASGDHDRMRDRIGRALAVFDELASTVEPGPVFDGAGGLLSMYRYCQERLVELAARRDPEAARDLASTIASMREAWAMLAAA